MGDIWPVYATGYQPESYRRHAHNTGLYPDPWDDHAAQCMPDSTWKILRYAEFISHADGVYRQALERVLSYFITEVEPSGDEVGDDAIDEFKDYLNKKFHVKSALRASGADYLIYGNSFISVLMKFRRYLSCPKCGLDIPFREMYDAPVYKFRWSGFAFNAYCPKCKYDGDWGKPIDRKGGPDDVFLKRWNPHEIELKWDPYTEDILVVWKINPEYRRLVTEGKPHVLENIPYEILQAVKKNRYFEFSRDAIFHVRDLPAAGLYTRGWGIPKAIINFRQAYYVQVLRRFNEAIALEMTAPFRVITPPVQSGGDPSTRDPVLNMNLAGFTSRVMHMLKKQRIDPAQINVLPWPIQYQTLGGDAKNFAPKELLETGIDTLLTSTGVPVELYKGTVNLQTLPTALRLFEAQWTPLVSNLNRLLTYIAKRLALLLSWPPVDLQLMPVTFADDTEARALKLQLAAGGQISQSTALKSIGIDFRTEEKRKMQDSAYQAEVEEKAQESMQKQQAGNQLLNAPAGQGQPGQPGQPAPGGDPSQGGQPGQPSPTQSAIANMPTDPNTPITLDDLAEKAQTIASQLITMPETQRKTELNQLKKANPNLQRLVVQALSDMRNQARSQGQQMVISQMGGGQ